MPAELATFTLSAPVSVNGETSLDAGTTAQNVSSGRVLSLDMSVVNNTVRVGFSCVDQNGLSFVLTTQFQGSVPAGVTSALATFEAAALALVESLATAKLPGGTTATFTAG